MLGPFGPAPVRPFNALSCEAVKLRLQLPDPRQLDLKFPDHLRHLRRQHGCLIDLGKKAGDEFGHLGGQRGNLVGVILPGWSGWAGRSRWSGASDVARSPALPASGPGAWIRAWRLRRRHTSRLRRQSYRKRATRDERGELSGAAAEGFQQLP